MADFVTDIILARDIGGFISIMENNWQVKKNHQLILTEKNTSLELHWKAGSVLLYSIL